MHDEKHSLTTAYHTVGWNTMEKSHSHVLSMKDGYFM
jgi:hypothetical protein